MLTPPPESTQPPDPWMIKEDLTPNEGHHETNFFAIPKSSAMIYAAVYATA